MSNRKKAPAPRPEPAPEQANAKEKKLSPKQKKVAIALIAVIAATLVVAIVLLSLALTGNLKKKEAEAILCSRDVDKGFKAFYVEGKEYKGLYAVMTITDGEKDYDIEILLLPEYAPITVANFTQYVDEGFYDGTVFHRIVDSTHVLQGGSYEYKSTDGDDVPEAEKTYQYVLKKATHDAIKGEFKNGTADSDNDGTCDYEYNIISHFAGAISMARTNDKNSATSGFFLMWQNYPTYDGDYAAFGFIVDPEDVNTIKSLAKDVLEKENTDSSEIVNPKKVLKIKTMKIVDTRDKD